MSKPKRKPRPVSDQDASHPPAASPRKQQPPASQDAIDRLFNILDQQPSEPATPEETPPPVPPAAVAPQPLPQADFTTATDSSLRKPLEHKPVELKPKDIPDFVWQSLQSGQPIAYNAQSDQPAILAYARPLTEAMGSTGYSAPEATTVSTPPALLLQILDEDPQRVWGEDEITLVEQVTDQLTLALENAQLFEESRKRAEQLAILNEMSRKLSEQLEVDQVLQTIYRYTAQLLDASNFFVAIYDPQTNQITFPIVIDKPTEPSATGAFVSQPELWEPQPFGNGLTEYILRTHQPVLIRQNASEFVQEKLGIEIVGSDAQSWLGVPMLYGDQAIGVIAVQNYTSPNVYDEEDRDLLSAIANQAVVATQNARLFQQTQSALSALEISERYQKSVAQATSALTERNIAALGEVLQILGEAARASRAYYFETQVDGRGSYWRLISEWNSTGVAPQISNPNLRRISTNLISSWLEQLRTTGYVTSRLSDLPEETRRFLQGFGSRSILQFAVLGRHELPGCIGFEQVDYDRVWNPDEISALQTAASALANTIAREDLFTQVQINLAETEALYQASARLNSASTYDDILSVLRQHTILGHLNASHISIHLFDRPWTGVDKPERLIPLTRYTTDRQSADEITGIPFSTPASSDSSSPLSAWTNAEQILYPDRTTAITDITSDPRLDETARRLYIDQMGAKSLLYTPLNVAGRWVGHIIAVFRQITGFPEHEIRRLMSLAGQAAVAVQNIHSLQLAEQRLVEAQKRGEELSIINRTVSSVAASLDLQSSLEIVAHQIGQALNVQVGIALLDLESSENEAQRGSSGQFLTLVAQHFLPTPTGEIPESMVGIKIPVEGNLSTQQVLRTQRPLYVEDAQHDPITAPVHEMLSLAHVRSMLILPLIASNQVIGTVGIDILEPGASEAAPEIAASRIFTPDEIRLAETIVIQASTAIQNARLFDQTQRVLAETETLYQASARFQVAQSYEDILEALRTFTILGEGSFHVAINLFDQPWRTTGPSESAEQKTENRPLWIIPIARWFDEQSGNLPVDVLSVANDRYPLQAFPSAERYFKAHKVTVISDIATDTLLDENARTLYHDLYKANAAIFAPLLAGGQWIGIINALYAPPSTSRSLQVSETNQRRLLALAGQAAVAIQNLRLLEESRRRANQLQTAAEIARDTSGTLALQILLSRTVNLLCQRFGYYHASIFLIDETGQEAHIMESTGEAGEEMKRRHHKLAVGSRSVIGQVTLTGQPIVLNDVTEAQARSIHRFNPLLPLTRAELGIPLQSGRGGQSSAERIEEAEYGPRTVIGALDVQSATPNAFQADDITVLQILADQIAVAVENARSYELSQKAAEELREADRLKSQFLANMSHELRTPLNSIIGFSRVILKGIDGPINELQQQDLSAIYNSGQHLLGLINDVLDLSKIEAGKMELAFEENVNLADIIKGAMSTAVGLVKDKPVQLHQQVELDLPHLRIDPMKVRQVLINLLSNASKFTEQGTITVRAERSTSPEGRPEVIVKVIDTGPGIAVEDQIKLFQPFSQVDGSLTRKTGGSGLGLSICHHYIRMHGGRIGLESEVGTGSTFYFTLPTPEAQEAAIQNAPEKPELQSNNKAAANTSEAAKETAPATAETPSESKETSPSTAVDAPPATSETQAAKPPAAPPVKPTTPPTESSPQAASVQIPEEAPSRAAGEAGAEIAQVPSETLTTTPISELQGGLVIAVDRDPQIIDVYRRYLADYNYHILALNELQQVATVARGLQPTAITLDISIQASGPTPTTIIDGWAVLRELKSDPGTKNIPVIICTLAMEQEKAQQMGADFYLLKPILQDDLLHALAHLQSAPRKSH